jgi:glutamate-1-semialdehyde 2,1-aminomutase
MNAPTSNPALARTRDAALRDRALRVVPGGMYGHLDASLIGADFPQYFARGRGALIWDVDDNEYVDLMCSWGPILLGHRHPRVEAAAQAQREAGDCLDGPSPAFVELAEAFVDTVDHADWAMFSKNGTDATSLAVRIARQATGRDRVLVARGAYHGAAAWCVPGGAGATDGDRADLAYYEYNDLASVQALVDGSSAPVAAIVACPIRHDLARDLELVDPAFARGLRELCDRIGAVLVLDEVRCGLRLDLRGSWASIGVEPDLSAWSKAIANGYALACLLGVDALRDAAAETYTTGSFWMGSVPLAAAVATLDEARATDVVTTIGQAGERLVRGLDAQARAHGLAVTLSGPPQMPFMTFADDPGLEVARAWANACVRAGLYVHPGHNWFLSAAHTPELIDRALEASDAAFAAVARDRD